MRSNLGVYGNISACQLPGKLLFAAVLPTCGEKQQKLASLSQALTNTTAEFDILPLLRQVQFTDKDESHFSARKKIITAPQLVISSPCVICLR